MELGLVARSASTVVYPFRYASSGFDVQILSPIEGPIQRGKTYTFKVGVANKSNVAVIMGSDFIQLLKGSDGYFTGNVTISGSTTAVSIGIANGSSGRYEFVASYPVK
jgi:hypothetical protein